MHALVVNKNVFNILILGAVRKLFNNNNNLQEKLLILIPMYNIQQSATQ